MKRRGPASVRAQRSVTASVETPPWTLCAFQLHKLKRDGIEHSDEIEIEKPYHGARWFLEDHDDRLDATAWQEDE